MLDIKGVKKSYGEFQLDCSLNVEKGRITGLVGENGAGKSTVFKAVLGLISYDGGEIKILGKTPQELNEKEKEQIGVVLAEAGFSGYLKGKDVKAVLAKLYPKFEEEKFLQMCERYQIPLDKFLKEYSTGMKAKLNLIIALTHQADFLMLDEPTAGLDVGAREGMLDILRTYMEEEPERSILISSHISSDLEHLCDDIYVIHKGKIVLHEEMDRILEKYAMLKVSEEQYQALDKNYILKERKENFGIACLTNEKQYYNRKLSGNCSGKRITRSGDSDVDRRRDVMKGIRGLLEKDFSVVFFGKVAIFFFVLAFVALFFTLTEKETATFIAIYIPSVIAVYVGNTISYDENNHGYMYLFSLPVNRKVYVREKYIFSFIMTACGWCIGVICAGITVLIKPEEVFDPEMLAMELITIFVFQQLRELRLQFG